MQEFEINAYAKINLSLDVVGRLENGYHLVKMIMQTVGIYDTLQFTKTEEGIQLITDCGELPLDDNNLIYKAILLMQKEYNLSGGIQVKLTKRIPIAAGMAGGSTDCAATLKAMNVLYDLNLPLERLQELGVKLGADVPYCVMGGTALAEGIGEKLTALPAAPQCILLVAKPDINVSTKYVYEHLDAEGVAEHPKVDEMIDEIRKKSLQGVADLLGNVLETVTVEAHPIVTTIKEKMLLAGALNSLMSGSGPTVFGIFDEEKKAKEAYRVITEEKLAKQVFLTGFVE